MMINDEEMIEDQEVTSATMRRLAFEKIEDEDYYLGGAVGEDVMDSDDDASSDDEIKSHFRKLAGFEEKKEEKDIFGRRRRRSEFEDDMDDELDRSISEYAAEHMGVPPNVKIEEITDDECKKIDRQWRLDNEENERKIAALERLPYDVDLTDSEVDPEMPAAVVKNKHGEAMKLVYSCNRTQEFDVEERRKRQKERRDRVAESRMPESQRRQKMIKTVVDSYSSSNKSDVVPTKKKFIDSSAEPSSSTTQNPLKSIMKKTNKTPEKKKVEIEEKIEDEKMDEGVEAEDEDDEKNPIKKALKDRLKEIEKNDDLLYDDEEDDANEKWVTDRRKEARGDDSAPGNEADGVLSCPGCMVELSRDCQRHEIYKTQYRAMFVTNCRLDEQKMTVEKTGKEKRREKQKTKRQADGIRQQDGNDDLFTPVKCSSCGTLVAMMDSDEIYHFFNVLAGYS